MDHKESLNTAQQTVALDTKYNTFRPLPNQHRMLYLRRRNQLLQENAKYCDDVTIRQFYLQQRSLVLASKYGPLDKRSNKSNNSRRSSTRHSNHQSMESLPLSDNHLTTKSPRGRGPLMRSGLVPTKSADASRALAGDSSLAEHYAFCGMHHIFDKHKDAVTIVQFSHDDKTRLACASRDGTLTVFSLVSEPPSLAATLRGHTRAVNDFDWSVANDFIVSASSDGTCRLWDPTNGSCLRVITDSPGARTLSCKFHPTNNNLLALGNSKAQVRLFNVSTGMAVKNGSGKAAGGVLCLAFEPTGAELWAGDSKGSIFSYILDKITWKLQRIKRLVVSQGSMVTSISYRTWVNREARDPSLLVSCADSTLRLFRLLPNKDIYLKRKFSVAHSTQPVKSAFCPLMSFLQGACVVSGGEDGGVHFFDVDSGAIVNELQGHSSPVLSVAWTYDESLLASCDIDGTVIVWKRGGKT
ncbi:WD repeat-containing protein 13-like isoform X2 [Halichondria panicea]|uniref:WD repeat-containing protein 13-like isoform X2 n=1 Tax=Halichondria panicea TaxID=6063 RepID=UPI00312BCA33